MGFKVKETRTTTTSEKVVSFSKIKWRLNAKYVKVSRHSTGYQSLDELLGGGLPKGNILLAGNAGSGKSLLARNISLNSDKALYICAEVLGDAPWGHKNVIPVDYTRYLPDAYRALDELMCFIENVEPDMIVIDSITSFFSQSKKALPESDLRELASDLHKRVDNKLPVICISELRGAGINTLPSGGRGLEHACTMYIKMETKVVTTPWDADRYACEIGEKVYTILVEKDKGGLSKTREHLITYGETGDIILKEI